ncbi:MAG: amidohydrolase family protein [Actinomycetota bacterium]
MLELTGGLVVESLDPPRLARKDLLMEDGRISEGGRFGSSPPRLDCSGCLLIPGNVCAHHHLYSTLARGMPYRLDPPENFVQILQRIWWRLDRALDHPLVWSSAQAGGLDALLAGTTTIVDHHASPNFIEESLELIAGALDHIGVRSVLCYEVTDRDGVSRAEAGLEVNRRWLKEQVPLAAAMVGAHASFTLSDETLAACADVARDFDSGIHIHVAEDEADQRDAEARFGKRVVHRLADAGALNDKSLLAHCIHLDDAEAEVINASGATVVHNPRSNMNNRVGHTPVEKFARLALGTDGIGGDMFAESKASYWRARESDPAVDSNWVLGRMAASARFAGSVFGEPLLGQIAPGAPADVVVLEYDPPTPLTEENLGDHWLFGLSARDVRDVVVGGELVVRNRGGTRVDQEEIVARSREGAERLWKRMEEIPEHPFTPAGVR